MFKQSPQHNTWINARHSHSSTLSDINSWHKVVEVNPATWYSLGMVLYDTILTHPEVDSGHTCLKNFLDNLKMEFNI
jgi:hypothetical protein